MSQHHQMNARSITNIQTQIEYFRTKFKEFTNKIMIWIERVIISLNIIVNYIVKNQGLKVDVKKRKEIIRELKAN